MRRMQKQNLPLFSPLSQCDSFHDLNEEQRQAVFHGNKPLLILAGAGSGKTRVIIKRIFYLLSHQKVDPQKIVAVTFTNKAAEEMKERLFHSLATLESAEEARSLHSQVHISTFHRLGACILREIFPDFLIYDQEESLKVLDSCIKQEQKPTPWKAKQLQSLISQLKNRLILPEELPEDFLPKPKQALFVTFYAAYQRELEKARAVDFDDLIFLPITFLQKDAQLLHRYQERWHYFLVDEYQDTSHAQYTLLKLLARQHAHLFVVGDPDQSIYSWRGAQVENILSFAKRDFPDARTICLEQNYRSTTTILQAANALIQWNSCREEKNLWSALGEGEKVGLFLGKNGFQEALFVAEQLQKHAQKGIPWKEMVIFYRTNPQSRLFEDVLFQHTIPYTIVGGISFHQRREIKDLLAFLRIALINCDTLSFVRTINLSKCGWGKTSLNHLLNLAKERSLPIFSLCEELTNPSAPSPPFRLTSRQREGLQRYVECIRAIRAEIERGSLSSSMKMALEKSGYLFYLREEPESYEERKNNLDELLAKAREWEVQHAKEENCLFSFLEEMTLRSDPANYETNDCQGVQLMTLHNGKGLEFTVTFLVGLEEDLFPHINCKSTPEQIEEERRLCYVGMTRAKRKLYLSAAKERSLWGSIRLMQPSRFLQEVPSYLINPC